MKKHIRTLCALLSAVMLLPVFSTLTAAAETAPLIPEITPAPIEQTENAAETATSSEPELLNVSSGSVVVDVGKTYRPVLDGFELASINSFSACVQPQAGNLLYANAIGTAQIMLLYYNENNILSVFNCQIEVMDVLGTIDVTRSNVFVEKGQKYILDFGDLDVYSVNIMNYNTLILRPLANYKAIEAVEADTVNIYYSYYDENKTSISAVCTVEVYKEPDSEIFNSHTNSYFITLSPTPDSVFHCLAYQNDASGSYPIMQYHGNYDSAYQNFTIISSINGYYRIFAPLYSSYMGIDQSSATTDAEITFINSLSITDSQIIDWKILQGKDSRLLLVPKNAENNQIILSSQGGTVQNGDRLELRAYDQSNSGKVWSLFSTTIYINNYYDKSLQDNTIWDQDIISLIPTANDFLNDAFFTSFNRLSFGTGLSPTAVFDSPTDSEDCPSGIDAPCFCSNTNHKSVSKALQYTYHLPRNNSEISVLWTDRPENVYYFDHPNTTPTYDSAIACIMRPYPSSIMFFTIARTSAIYLPAIEAKMSIVLAHEVAHTMGLSEQYGDKDKKTEHDIYMEELKALTSKEYCCVMEKCYSQYVVVFYEDILRGDINAFCDLCVEKMEGFIYNNFHYAN